MLPVSINCKLLITPVWPHPISVRIFFFLIKSSAYPGKGGISPGINCSAPPVVGLDWQGAFYKVN